MNKTIKEKINKELPNLKEKYPIKKLGVFGSFARGEQKKTSDIDVVVEFNSPIGFFDFIRLENSLSEILQKKVDLVSKKAIKPAIKKRVLKETIYV